MENKRLQLLEQMASSPSADPFALYGLAMEYRRLGRASDALRVFERLRNTSPDYLPMYLMAGQLLMDGEEPEAARPWLTRGIELAAQKGDEKALSELNTALAQLD